MEKVKVDLGEKSYEIIIGDKLENLGKYIGNYSKILVLSNTKVGKLYGRKVVESLKGRNIVYFEIEDGEEYKTIESAKKVYDVLIDNEFTRDSLIISLGGGVVCDLSGYIASTYMRGIDFVQVPTSLLAQVDASVGGKVAVNYRGKNLIGAFYQPKLVFMDTNLLKTLDEREIKTGIAETLKIALCFDKEFYTLLDEKHKEFLDLDISIVNKIIKKAVELKAMVVSQDEREKGLRAQLNYGHSFGHVIESLTDYKVYRHGEAVVVGMNFALQLAKYLGLATDDYVKLQENLFEKYNLDSSIPKFSYERMLEILKRDKKNSNGKIKFVFSSTLGTSHSQYVSEEDLRDFYEKLEGNKVRGVIDLGTNTCRLFVAEVNNQKIIRRYLKEVEIIKLGEDVDKNKFLLQSAIERALVTFKKYKKIADSMGVTEILAKATSATRDASNRDEFIDRIKREVGVNLSCISGEEEGTYTFRGASSFLKENILLVDIGGGSTELILGNSKDGIEYIKSFDIGAVRLLEKFFLDEKNNEDYGSKRVEAEEFIKNIFDDASILKGKNFTLVGVAGTATTQVSVKEEMEVYDTNRVHGYNLSLRDLEKNLKLFMSKDVEERKFIKGLHPKRAEVIISGTIILEYLMKYFDKKNLLISEYDILDGIMLD